MDPVALFLYDTPTGPPHGWPCDCGYCTALKSVDPVEPPTADAD